MLSKALQAVVLAAGKSSRFKTGKTKLIEKICGQEIILFTTKLLEQLNIETTLVVGHQKEIIQNLIKKHHQEKVHFVDQKELLGTGHAVACTRSEWSKDHILILNGDCPLVTEKIIEDLYKKHKDNNAAISFVVSHYTCPDHSYGRVIKDEEGVKIIEAKDFDKTIYDDGCCINAGIYIAKKNFLESCIDKIEKSTKTKEFYLTSLIEIACQNGLTVLTADAPLDRVRGINTLEELWAAEQIKRSEVIRYWMKHGVRFNIAQNIHIDIDVQIGSGTQIGCGVHLLSGTTIGKNCSIHKFSTVDNTSIEDNVKIHPLCVIRNSKIEQGAQIGPFAHVHTKSTIEKEAVIGNFVEVKQSCVGAKSFAKHLTYLGNASLGSNVNIGAGTITCNFDGVQKHNTVIKDNVFIGSNNTLIAPITIEQGAFTAAGSTITKDVPQNSLAIGRAKQVNKEAYAQKIFEKLKKQSEKINKQKKQDPIIEKSIDKQKEL